VGETAIQWTARRGPDGTLHKGYTWNPWSGCTKVSEGCKNCYAENLSPAMRRHAKWGPNEERKPAAEAYWEAPRAWDRKAAKDGVRLAVFVNSVSDFFEERDDLDPWRERAWTLMGECRHLDWLLVTKRVAGASRWSWHLQAGGREWWDHVMLLASVENQVRAEERIWELLEVPCRLHGVSMEPLLGPVDLRRLRRVGGGWYLDALAGGWLMAGRPPIIRRRTSRLDWIIVGGESGDNARPMHPDWARSLRDQAVAAGVPFHFKQWGEWAPGERRVHVHDPRAVSARDGRTGEPTFVMNPPGDGGAVYVTEPRDDMAMISRLGKHESGRLLDGRTWDEVPRG
jgi:protein gp37